MRRDNLIIMVAPVVSRSKPETRGHHWYTCMLSMQDLQKPVITIIDSSNKLKAGLSIANIINDYEQAIVLPLNKVLRSLELQEIARDEIRYAQGTQYGNMGCGITASRNIERLLLGGEFEALTEQSKKTSMSYEHVYYEDEKGDPHEEFHISAQRLLKLQQRYGEENVYMTEGIPSFPDISIKGNIILEALQRFELAKQISYREKFQKDIAHIIAGSQTASENMMEEEIPSHSSRPEIIKTLFHGLLKEKVPIASAFIPRGPSGG